jgi:PhzF family phenazine biosynthesis protein
MEIPLYQVDAFTDRVFAGNPAAVCPLEQWLDDELLQNIAAENNLSETAFFVPEFEGYRLRWFTPACEVDLCGHATLASAFVLMNVLGSEQNEVRFQSRSGELRVSRDGDMYSLDFPSRAPQRVKPTPSLIAGLGVEPDEVWRARDYMAVFATEQHVRALTPDMAKLAACDTFAIIATAPGRTTDFVSRFFAPNRGVPEDPVTGSAHCTLVPYWSQRLGKTSLHACQVSKRGGQLWCEDQGARVKISGRAVLFSSGKIQL